MRLTSRGVRVSRRLEFPIVIFVSIRPPPTGPSDTTFRLRLVSTSNQFEKSDIRTNPMTQFATRASLHSPPIKQVKPPSSYGGIQRQIQPPATCKVDCSWTKTREKTYRRRKPDDFHGNGNCDIRRFYDKKGKCSLLTSRRSQGSGRFLHPLLFSKHGFV